MPITGNTNEDVRQLLKKKEKKNGRMNVTQTTEELKEILEHMPDANIQEHFDDFTPRKYVLKKLSRSTYACELVDYLRKYYGMTKKEALDLVKSVRKDLNEQTKQLTKTVAARNIRYLYEIVDECIDSKIYDSAINAIKELNKMSGVVDSQNKVTIAKNSLGEEIINISFDS